MRLTRVAGLAVVVALAACQRHAARSDADLRAAIDCIGESQQCLIDKLGRPDRELLGPNSFDKRFVYNKAQLTIVLQPRDAAKVLEVGTGAVLKADEYGGPYDGDIFGLHLGETPDEVKQAWGPPAPPDNSIDASVGIYTLDYPGKVTTSAGRKVFVQVFYRNDKSGVYHVMFLQDR
jgi:hypothetical protein